MSPRAMALEQQAGSSSGASTPPFPDDDDDEEVGMLMNGGEGAGAEDGGGDGGGGGGGGERIEDEQEQGNNNLADAEEEDDLLDEDEDMDDGDDDEVDEEQIRRGRVAQNQLQQQQQQQQPSPQQQTRNQDGDDDGLDSDGDALLDLDDGGQDEDARKTMARLERMIVEAAAQQRDIYRWEDDDIALRAAAAAARLPADRLSAHEAAAFPDIAKARASTIVYLFVRNKTLQLWHACPLTELSAEVVAADLPAPFDSDQELVRRVHAYLQRYCYINFGVFSNVTATKLPPAKSRKILVLGAGAAGLACARQLAFFGFDVTVLEARQRVGGRVYTYKTPENLPVEMGVPVIHGVFAPFRTVFRLEERSFAGGNPLTTLVQQVNVTVERNTPPVALFDTTGAPIETRKEQLVLSAHRKIWTTALHVAVERAATTDGGSAENETAGGDQEMKVAPQPLSMEAAHQALVNQLELRVQRRRLEYWRKYEDILRKLGTCYDEMAIFKRSVQHIARELVRGSTHRNAQPNDENQTSDQRLEADIIRRCHRRDLAVAVARYDELEGRRKMLEMSLTNLRSMEPNEVYMNELDRRVMDWQLTKEEARFGAPLHMVGLAGVAAAEFASAATPIQGSDFVVKEGLCELMTHLCRELDVQTQKRKANVAVRVECADGTEHSADFVVCTFPLGVLKRSVQEDETQEAATSRNGERRRENPEPQPLEAPPRFHPPLPEKHVEAIKRLGFGNQNKLYLQFDKGFWDDKTQRIGQLAQSGAARGELYRWEVLFPPKTPTDVASNSLLGYFAGASASLPERMDKKAIWGRASAHLHQIYGLAGGKDPKLVCASKWGREPQSLGAFSYPSLACDGTEWTTISQPVSANGGGGSGDKEPPRLFFAGEHTSAQFPGTLHGAFLSGLREAARIADQVLGRPTTTTTVRATTTAAATTERAENDAPGAGENVVVTLSDDETTDGGGGRK